MSKLENLYKNAVDSFDASIDNLRHTAEIDPATGHGLNGELNGILEDLVHRRDGMWTCMMEARFGKPTATLIGANGNIFNLLGIASKALERNQQCNLASVMYNRVTDFAGDYDNALRIIMEYVEIE